MSDALDKAEAAVTAAETNTAAVQLAFAAMELAKLAQQQRPADQPACEHQHDRRPGRSAGEWIGISCAICIGGIGIAFASIAIAIGGLSAAVLALVVRSMWRDVKKGR